jgi:hypothetical protein
MGKKNLKFKVEFNDDKNRGKIITPYTYMLYGYSNPFTLEVNFNELYKCRESLADGGMMMYSFAKYGICQFNVKSKNIKSAIESAIERLQDIYKDGIPNKNDAFVVSGFRYNEDNKKVSYLPSFMEDTHIRNQFTKNSFTTKKGDILRYDDDGDGWGFWYAIDNDGKRVSTRLKGSILISYIADGVVVKKTETKN